MLIGVTEYQEVWPLQYAHAAAQVRAAVGDLAARVDHIGSTAVPGLAAKPIIDVMVSVPVLAQVDRVVHAMTAVGFVYRPDADNDQPPPWESTEAAEWRKAYFRTPAGVAPRVHVHFREMGRRNQRYALLCRDYLRSNARARNAYGEYKRLASDAVGHLSGAGGTGPYLELKAPVLDLIANSAEEWAEQTQWRLPGPD